MNIEKFIESITLPIQNKDYLYLYDQLRKKISILLEEFNTHLEKELFENENTLNFGIMKQIYQEVIDLEKSTFNPFFNEGKISVTSIKEFFEIIKDKIKEHFSTLYVEKIIQTCDEFFEKYIERINTRVSKVLQKKKIQENFDLESLHKTKLLSNSIKAQFFDAENKEEIIKNAPFKTSVETFEKDLKNFLNDIDNKIKIINKLSNEIKVENVLNGIETYKEFKERLENLKTEKETEYESTGNKELLKEIEFIEKSLKDIESAVTVKEVKEVLKNQLSKTVLQIKNIDRNSVNEFIKETQKESENQEKLFKTIISKLGNSETEKELKEQLIYLEKMYELQKEKREDEIAAKNLEKAKNDYLSPQIIEQKLNQTQNLENVKKEKEEFSSIEDYFYKKTTKLLQKIDNLKPVQILNKKISDEKLAFKNLIEEKKYKLLPYKDKILNIPIQEQVENISKDINSNELEEHHKKIQIQKVSQSILNQPLIIPKLSSSPDVIEQNLNSIAKSLGLMAYIEREDFEDKSVKEKEYSIKGKLKNKQQSEEEIFNDKKSDIDVDFDRDKKDKDKNKKNKRPGKNKKPSKKNIFKNITKNAKNLVKFGGTVLKKAPIVGSLLTAGSALYNFSDKNTSENLGINEKDITTGDKITSSIGSLAEGFSFGLLDYKDTENAARYWKHNFIDKFETSLGFLNSESAELIKSIEDAGWVRTSTFGNSKITEKGWKIIPTMSAKDIELILKYDDWDEETERKLKAILKDKKERKNKKNFKVKTSVNKNQTILKNNTQNKQEKQNLSTKEVEKVNVEEKNQSTRELNTSGVLQPMRVYTPPILENKQTQENRQEQQNIPPVITTTNQNNMIINQYTDVESLLFGIL
jgi:endonuclease V-like protein UPF0215 family